MEKTKDNNDDAKYKDSLLIELIPKNEQIAAFYNFILCFVFSYLIQEITKDHFEHHNVYLGWQYANYWFEDLDLTLIFWTIIFTLHCALFKWIEIWQSLRRNNKNLKCLDCFGWSLVVLYFISALTLIPCLINKLETAQATSFAVIVEQVRFMVMSYSYVRENAWKVFKSEEKLPTFKQYLYFSFAPTLIYRDEYVKRTKPIRWGFVVKRILELSLSMTLLIYVHKSFYTSKAVQTFYEKDKFTLMDILNLWLQNFASANVSLWCIFINFFHCTQNIFGEILKFDDRNFYGDWWAAESSNTWWRKWNCIVGAWLNIYIYRELQNLLPNAFLRHAIIFFISGIVHEWGLTCSYRLFYGLSMVFVFLIPTLLSPYRPLKNRMNNFILSFVILFLGAPSLFIFATLEYCARKKADQLNAPYLDIVFLRSLEY